MSHTTAPPHPHLRVDVGRKVGGREVEGRRGGGGEEGREVEERRGGRWREREADWNLFKYCCF